MVDNETIAKLQKALEDKKESLEKELSAFAVKDPNLKDDWDSKSPRIPGAGIEGAADEVEEYGNRISIEHSLELQLKAVHEALERIEKGTYGTCLNCNAQISQERLEASLEAAHCAECKK